ncbi:MAG: restriction endonuclease subunit S [Verrucomicrobia bacterium]|nr:restriction endonuclease subunit S [Verrucomicrobiota bacterium]
MSDQHDSLLDALPDGWSFDRLKDVVALRNDKTDEASAEDDYIELEDLESGTGRILSRRNTLEVESAVTLFKKGDVLFGKLRPYLEKYYEAEFDGKCTGEILAFKPERIASRFLFYCVGSRWFIECCNALAYGAKMPRVSWPTQLSQFNVPLPPLPEQQRIAAYLDASCAALDAAVAAKRRQLDTLDALRRETITRVITRGLRPSTRTKTSGEDWLGEIPAHWSAPCLKRLLREPLTYGLNEAAELGDRDLPRYLRITDFDDDGNLRDDTFRSLPREIAREGLLEPNDVLFARSGATVGKTFMFRNYDGEACFAGYLIRARTLLRKLDPLFLYLFTKSTAYETWKNLIFTQATIQNISAAKYNYLAIPLPPLDEQQAIVAHLEEKSAEFRAFTAAIETQIATLTAYRKSLIHECVTGQRRISEADVKCAGVQSGFDNRGAKQ